MRMNNKKTILHIYSFLLVKWKENYLENLEKKCILCTYLNLQIDIPIIKNISLINSEKLNSAN